MKKIFGSIVLVAVLSFVLFVPALAQEAQSVEAAPAAGVVLQEDTPPASDDVTVPDDLAGFIKIFIGLLVAQGLKSLSKVFGKDISGYAAVITASLASSFIFFFNALLSAVPDTAEPTVAVLLTLLITILGSFGLKDTIKGFQVGAGKFK